MGSSLDWMDVFPGFYSVVNYKCFFLLYIIMRVYKKKPMKIQKRKRTKRIKRTKRTKRTKKTKSKKRIKRTKQRRRKNSSRTKRRNQRGRGGKKVNWGDATARIEFGVASDAVSGDIASAKIGGKVASAPAPESAQWTSRSDDPRVEQTEQEAEQENRISKIISQITRLREGLSGEHVRGERRRSIEAQVTALEGELARKKKERDEFRDKSFWKDTVLPVAPYATPSGRPRRLTSSVKENKRKFSLFVIASDMIKENRALRVEASTLDELRVALRSALKDLKAATERVNQLQASLQEAQANGDDAKTEELVRALEDAKRVVAVHEQAEIARYNLVQGREGTITLGPPTFINDLSELNDKSRIGLWSSRERAIEESTRVAAETTHTGKSAEQMEQEGKALRLAVENGELDKVRFWLNQGTDPNAANHRTGATPLQKAAYQGELGMVKLLVAEGAELDKADKNGLTPLILAATWGRRDVVLWLLNEGADPDKVISASEDSWAGFDGLNAQQMAEKKENDVMASLLEECTPPTASPRCSPSATPPVGSLLRRTETTKRVKEGGELARTVSDTRNKEEWEQPDFSQMDEETGRVRRVGEIQGQPSSIMAPAHDKELATAMAEIGAARRKAEYGF